MSGNQDEFLHLGCPRCGAPLQMSGEVFTCQYCGARLLLKRSTNRLDPSTGNPPGRINQIHGVTLCPFAYYDPQAGLQAFSMLVPQDWQVRGGVNWVITRPAAPAEISIQAYNPHGLEAFEAFPTLHFTWNQSPLMQFGKPTGSLHFGVEVRQPVPAREAMRKYVLPRYRKIAGLQVVDEGPASELLQAVTGGQAGSQVGGRVSHDSARVRLQYPINNQVAAEEMSGIVEYTQIGAPGLFGGMGDLYWKVDYLTSFRASCENLESYADLYRAIFASIQLNPTWMSLVQLIIQALSRNQVQHIRDIADISRQISLNATEMREQNLQGWQERSASYDRVAETFSQTIREVDPYYDPNTGQNVELPSGFTQAWSTPLGEYLLSDDPNFNPNIGSNQTWTPLTSK